MGSVAKSSLPAALAERLRQAKDATLLIDPERSVLLAASDSGAALLGLAASDTDTTLPLDAGMPAMGVLRRLLAGLPSSTTATAELMFWTQTGAHTLTCAIEGPFPLGDDAKALLVRVVAPEIERAGAAAPHDPTLARLAHELRTPFAAIAALADVMAEGRFGPLGNVRYQEYATGIRDTARHALGVVEATLAGPDVALSQPQLTFTEIDLMATASEVLRGLAPLAERAGLIFEIEASPGLPRVIADRTAIRQMLFNLATNALKYAGRGARMRIHAGQEPGGEAWIEVADDGLGMSSAAIADALDPGDGREAAAPDRSRYPNGSGLGLPLTRRLAAANGARLSLSPSSAKGLAARITFEPSRTLPV